MRNSFGIALSVDQYVAARLQEKLSTFNLAPSNVSDMSSLAEKVSGKSYVFEENQLGQNSIRFDFEKDKATIHLSGGWLTTDTFVFNLRGPAMLLGMFADTAEEKI